MQTLPQMEATGGVAGVRTMLAMDWAREVTTGWGATALNWAVYRGDTEMTQLLLDEGADWRTRHDFKDNVVGTLSWASEAQEDRAAPKDYAGCARVLLAHGVPLKVGKNLFSPDVQAYLDSVSEAAG